MFDGNINMILYCRNLYIIYIYKLSKLFLIRYHTLLLGRIISSAMKLILYRQPEREPQYCIFINYKLHLCRQSLSLRFGYHCRKVYNIHMFIWNIEWFKIKSHFLQLYKQHIPSRLYYRDRQKIKNKLTI